MSKIKSREDLAVAVAEALARIETMIASGEFERSREGFPNTRDLASFKEQLLRVKGELSANTIPPKKERRLWMGRVIVDDLWQWKDPFADHLLEVQHYYERKLVTDWKPM